METAKQKVLVIGGSSFLGYNFLQKAGGEYQLWATYNNHQIELPGVEAFKLDIRNLAATKEAVLKINPDVIILYSAVSSSNNSNNYEELNVDGTKNVVEACKEVGTKLIFLSTDYVFDGKNGPYTESDPRNPVQEYGQTKETAEKLVSELDKYAIVRTCLVYGSPKDSQHGNFVTNLVSTIQDSHTFFACTDMYRTPTYIEDVSAAVIKIIDNYRGGFFHVSSSEYVSINQFAEEVCEIFNLDKSYLKPVLADETESEKDKPRRAGLNPGFAENLLEIKFNSTKEGLIKMKEAFSDFNSNNTTSPQQTALVTGGAGFIGSHLVEELVQKGYFVKVIDSLVKGKLSSIQPLVDQKKVEFIEGDLRNRDSVDKAMKNVTYVFHTAGIHIKKSVESPEDAIDVNVRGSYNVFRSALEHNVKKVIFSSSSSVYGEPKTLPMSEDSEMNILEPYGASKLMCENLLKFLGSQGLNYSILRYFNVYGSRQAVHAYYTTVVIHFIKRIMNNEAPIIDGKGDQSMDFTHVSDVVSGNIAAAESDIVNEIFNIGTGKSTSVKELAEIIIKALGKDIEPQFREREVLVSRRQADVEKAKKLLNYSSKISVEDGMSIVAKEISEHLESYIE